MCELLFSVGSADSRISAPLLAQTIKVTLAPVRAHRVNAARARTPPGEENFLCSRTAETTGSPAVLVLAPARVNPKHKGPTTDYRRTEHPGNDKFAHSHTEGEEEMGNIWPDCSQLPI